MPTENRSSNTEQMVSVPLKLTEQQARDIQRFHDTCEDGQGYDVPKDRMKSLARLGLTRSLGFGRYELTDAGDSAVNELRDQPATQHQGDPVAWVIFDNGFIDDHTTDKDLADGWREQGLEVSALYTHADAGEVERLRDQLLELAKTIHKRHYAKSAPDFEPFDFSSGLIGQIDNMVAGMLQDLSTLRAQLAERDALLADAANLAMFTLPEDWHTRYAALSASAEPKSCGACANGCISGCQLEKDSPPIDAGITASVEPSAPVERDERAAFEADQLSKGFAVDLLPGTVATYMIPAVRFSWAGWQARAALERKP